MEMKIYIVIFFVSVLVFLNYTFVLYEVNNKLRNLKWSKQLTTTNYFILALIYYIFRYHI